MNPAITRQAKQQSQELQKLRIDHINKTQKLLEFYAKTREFEPLLSPDKMYAVIADEVKQENYLINDYTSQLNEMLKRQAEEKTRLINSFVQDIPSHDVTDPQHSFSTYLTTGNPVTNKVPVTNGPKPVIDDVERGVIVAKNEMRGKKAKYELINVIPGKTKLCHIRGKLKCSYTKTGSVGDNRCLVGTVKSITCHMYKTGYSKHQISIEYVNKKNTWTSTGRSEDFAYIPDHVDIRQLRKYIKAHKFANRGNLQRFVFSKIIKKEKDSFDNIDTAITRQAKQQSQELQKLRIHYINKAKETFESYSTTYGSVEKFFPNPELPRKVFLQNDVWDYPSFTGNDWLDDIIGANLSSLVGDYHSQLNEMLERHTEDKTRLINSITARFSKSVQHLILSGQLYFDRHA